MTAFEKLCRRVELSDECSYFLDALIGDPCNILGLEGFSAFLQWRAIKNSRRLGARPDLLDALSDIGHAWYTSAGRRQFP